MDQVSDAAPIELIDPRTPPPAAVGAVGQSAARSLFGVRVDSPGIGDVSEVKERSARGLALIITWTFALSAALILFGIYRILVGRPGDAEALLSRAAVPALKEAGLFLSSVFGPLLAFVLGYYFGERNSSAS